jgi:hypothetical protein
MGRDQRTYSIKVEEEYKEVVLNANRTDLNGDNSDYCDFQQLSTLNLRLEFIIFMELEDAYIQYTII